MLPVLEVRVSARKAREWKEMNGTHKARWMRTSASQGCACATRVHANNIHKHIVRLRHVVERRWLGVNVADRTV